MKKIMLILGIAVLSFGALNAQQAATTSPQKPLTVKQADETPASAVASPKDKTNEASKSCCEGKEACVHQAKKSCDKGTQAKACCQSGSAQACAHQKKSCNHGSSAKPAEGNPQ